MWSSMRKESPIATWAMHGCVCIMRVCVWWDRAFCNVIKRAWQHAHPLQNNRLKHYRVILLLRRLVRVYFESELFQRDQSVVLFLSVLGRISLSWLGYRYYWLLFLDYEGVSEKWGKEELMKGQESLKKCCHTQQEYTDGELCWK